MKCVVLRRLAGADWRIWRDVRLAALADAPGIFHGDLEEERALGDQEWLRWTLDGVKSVALCGQERAGVAAGRLRPERPGTVELYGMWVEPQFRGAGVAAMLAEDVLAWAREQGSGAVELWVIAGNGPAERLYRRLGFEATGEQESHPSIPGLSKYVMARSTDGVARTCRGPSR
ncbi:N-acetyltransferase [Sphaerisporangium melleum]|uniref:N-acetyltransferase n=2 Tax=Sphaerisporangium melleum TaxID=321316 RepID=A0A917VGP0_9ACTN|nr:GNAT family N-acetyltransferase [Sphaerisporangium melleum]GGK79022.1 N-acetyltransferase [Sphaerisporangium melleum]GII69751.1 N-acetyltransferase [Sphaerisporangium melleum]